MSSQQSAISYQPFARLLIFFNIRLIILSFFPRRRTVLQNRALTLLSLSFAKERDSILE